MKNVDLKNTMSVFVEFKHGNTSYEMNVGDVSLKGCCVRKLKMFQKKLLKKMLNLKDCADASVMFRKMISKFFA